MEKRPTYEELVTKIEELEQKLQVNQFLLEKSIDVIWRMDLKLRFTYLTPSLYDVVGYTPEEWLGTRLSAHVTYRQFIRMARLAFSIIKGYKKNEVEVFEAVMMHKNGTPVDVEVAGKVLFNKKGLPVEIIGSTRMITERKEAERELERYAQQLKESNATKDRFFSIVAHDLRSPFNALIGFSDLLENEARNTEHEKIKYYSSMISKTLWRSLDYLNNLLEWSRLQSDKIEYEPTSFNMLLLAEEIREVLQAQAEGKNIRLTLAIPENLTITGDLNMLKTVWINLISNAIKYSYPESEIIISGKRNQDHSHFSVQDRGVGMKPEEQEKIFRVEEMHSTKGTNDEVGTGLGLILCKEFIKKHNGEIGMESKYGKGSTFWFNIPAQ